VSDQNIEVTVDNRWTTFDNFYPEELYGFLAYYKPGYFYSPAYHARDANGNRVWDGKEHLIKRRRIPTGAFLEFKK